MAVTLVAVGMLREYTGGQERLEVPAGPTVSEMLETVGIPAALVAAVLKADEIVPKQYRPQEGETLKLLAVAGGGV